MNLISRAEALTSKYKHFFTGQPCFRGHISRRYVSNGACVDCLSEKAGREPGAKRATVRYPNLAELSLRVYESDWPMVRATAHAYFHAVAPDLTPPAERAPRARASGTALYTVRVPVEYAQAMTDASNALLATHRPDVAARRAEILRTVCAMADEHGARPD